MNGTLPPGDGAPGDPASTPVSDDDGAGSYRRRRRRRSSRLSARLSAMRIVVFAAVAVVLALVAATFMFRGGSAGPVANGSASASVSGSGLPVQTGGFAQQSASSAVASSRPVATRIAIARLNIDLPIVEGDGVDAPLNKVAHYPGTAWPGEGSNVYLYAHARVGMFINLWFAKVGDSVDITLANGSHKKYVVSKILPSVEWNDRSVLAPSSAEELTLQTCTAYSPAAPRFIVIAVPSAVGQP
jgi:LPXTG-site transpeptidase (sortase) family protein